jgi:hypothetical protein
MLLLVTKEPRFSAQPTAARSHDLDGPHINLLITAAFFAYALKAPVPGKLRQRGALLSPAMGEAPRLIQNLPRAIW